MDDLKGWRKRFAPPLTDLKQHDRVFWCSSSLLIGGRCWSSPSNGFQTNKNQEPAISIEIFVLFPVTLPHGLQFLFYSLEKPTQLRLPVPWESSVTLETAQSSATWKTWPLEGLLHPRLLDVRNLVGKHKCGWGSLYPSPTDSQSSSRMCLGKSMHKS